MSTKPFKDIEQLMRDAAAGFEQPFDEESWRKMELLLDKEKQPRRPLAWLWWLFPALLLPATTLFIYDQKGGSKMDNKTGLRETVRPIGGRALATPASSQSASKNTALNSDITVPRKTATIRPLDRNDIQRPDDLDKTFQPTASHTPKPDNKFITDIIIGSARERQPAGAAQSAKLAYSSSGKSNTVIEAPGPLVNDADVQNKENGKAPVAVSLSDKSHEAPRFLPQTVDTISEGATGKAAKRSVDKKPMYSRWYFVAATGIESSSTKLVSTDKFNSKSGILVGYQFSRRVSLQSGFYASRKKYVAGPSDYYTRPGSYWSTVDIKSVDANCLVYEVPVDLRYDIHPPSEQLRVFATGGLSSYIMQEEDYRYTYNRYGYTHTAEAGYSGNRHLLSVVRLGAGVEKRLAKNFSVHASPRLSFPLGGVGEGKVKLYSTEILLGVRYNAVKKARKL